MSLRVKMKDLEMQGVELSGILPVKELDINGLDKVIHPNHDLKYEFAIQKIEKKLLLNGSLSIDVDCECVRCLKSFVYHIELNQWSLTLNLEGEEKVKIENDTVDLTPYLREDIVLSLPLHPVCEPECAGMPELAQDNNERIRPFGNVLFGLSELDNEIE
jgi:uncharacterized metal-binding protein YceD (DUF177 family)